MFVNIAFLARFGIGHDAARHGSGYLSCHNLHAFRSFYYYGGTLVVGAGFGQPRFHELSVLVPYLLYRAVYRIPVGVYINQTHEYRYHDTAVVEVFVFLHFFHHYDFTVGRINRKKLPFGVCQIGKSFRNEITPGNFTFRTREFEQMELEFFCKPGTELDWFAYWKDFCHKWLLELGMQEENLRLRDHEPEELSHYSNATTDFEFAFPFGWGELWGVASRTNYDLNAHQTTSGKDQTYFDQESGEHYIPFVIEPSLGADRVTLAFLVDAYDEEVVGQDKNGKDDVRTVLRLHPALAPFKCAVLPLSKKLGPAAQEIQQMLAKDFMVDYDEAGSIGKRYRRQDEIGTPYCVTVDFETVGDGEKAADHCVTVRDRDTMEQVRLPIDQLKAYLQEKMAF